MISTIEKQLYDKKCLKVMAMKSTRGGGGGGGNKYFSVWWSDVRGS